ncbi:MAG TPA: SGNH/GDSL hydrolase family protein [Polyangiaceae bacterium]|nr:SGNH/GDSL hydrolase family protein [Polyangiaceae bacterium]
MVATAAVCAQGCSSDDALAPAGASGGAGGNSMDAAADSRGAGGNAVDASGSGGAGGTGGATGGAAGKGGASGTSGGAGTTGGGAGTTGGGAGTTGGTAGTSDGSAGRSGAGGSDLVDASGVDAQNDADVAVDSVGSPDAVGDGSVSRPPCMKSPNQVVLIGDSYINWVSHTFPADLTKEAGVTYRMYAVGGTAMASGGLGLIPPQFDQAVAADPNIIAMIMDGGGNDILVADTAQFPQGADCKQNLMSPMIPDCQKIVDKAVTKAVELMDTAADKGVKDVVYFYYPHVPDGTLIGGAHPNAILDYALPRVRATCDGASTRTGGRMTCHFLDLIPVFDGHPDWFAFTDIHPNPTGSQAMAKAVWAIMKDKCIAQPASSGCCAP